MHRVIFFFLFVFAYPALALEVPQLKGRVNDYADLMPRDRAAALERRLEQFERDTGHQIVVLTVPSLDGEPIENFSIAVGEKWKIGKKGYDNGAILIIAQKDRRLRIEAGYGLEGMLPDAVANRIIEEQIVPLFRNGDFAGGIEAGVAAIMKVTQGEPLPEAQRRKPTRSTSGFPAGLILPLLLLGFFLFASLGGGRRRGLWSTGGRRGYYGSGPYFGGGWGGGGGWGEGSGGGGFSGGGGGFGGGGASGSW